MAHIGIQALGGSTDIQSEETANDTKDLLSSDLIKIPWTIENRYYSADVHFAVHPMRGLAPYILQNVPAIIFVWESNKVSYSHQTTILKLTVGICIVRHTNIMSKGSSAIWTGTSLKCLWL